MTDLGAVPGISSLSTFLPVSAARSEIEREGLCHGRGWLGKDMRVFRNENNWKPLQSIV